MQMLDTNGNKANGKRGLPQQLRDQSNIDVIDNKDLELSYINIRENVDKNIGIVDNTVIDESEYSTENN